MGIESVFVVGVAGGVGGVGVERRKVGKEEERGEGENIESGRVVSLAAVAARGEALGDCMTWCSVECVSISIN